MAKQKVPKWIQVEHGKFVIKIGPRGNPEELVFFETKCEAEMVYAWALKEQAKEKTSSRFTRPQRVRVLTSFVRVVDPVPTEILNEYDRKRKVLAKQVTTRARNKNEQ